MIVGVAALVLVWGMSQRNSAIAAPVVVGAGNHALTVTGSPDKTWSGADLAGFGRTGNVSGFGPSYSGPMLYTGADWSTPIAMWRF